MLIEALGQIEFWHWWIAGAVLLGIEIVTGTFALLWLAISAGLVGVVLFLFPNLRWEGQFLIFGVLAVVLAIAWHHYQKRRGHGETENPALNQRGKRYLDRTFTLESAVINGQGKLRIDDTLWKVEGEDLPEGTKVRVVGVEGTHLRIERADQPAAAGQPAPMEGE